MEEQTHPPSPFKTKVIWKWLLTISIPLEKACQFLHTVRGGTLRAEPLASPFISSPAGISSPPCIASAPTPLGGAAWRTHGKSCEAGARSIQAGTVTAEPLLWWGGFLVEQCESTSCQVQSTWRGKGESQDLGSTSKTAAREESLSPKEYKNQWGDEQGSNCKNSDRGKHAEKRRTERMGVGGHKAQTCKEKVLSTAILAYSTSLKEPLLLEKAWQQI